MTGPHSETEGPDTRSISVAELLARNGTVGEPVSTRRRRRRRGDSDAVTVAELTGEIPVIREHERDAEREADGGVRVAEPVSDEPAKAAYWSEPEPRWPKSPPQPRRPSGPQRSEYPGPLPHGEPAGRTAEPGQQSGAEHMSPDPLDHYADIPVDVMDSEGREAEPATEDSAYVRSFLQSDSTLFGGQTLADEVARRRGGQRAAKEVEQDHVDTEAPRTEEAHAAHGRLEALWRGSLIVLQSILAVAFGAALVVAFA